jgi:hypothetical protein
MKIKTVSMEDAPVKTEDFSSIIAYLRYDYPQNALRRQWDYLIA